MHMLRALILRHRLLAAMLVVCALAVKAAVPAGYMLGQHGTVLTVEICTDASGGAVTQQIVIPRTHGPASDTGEHGKAPATCPYAALGLGTLGGTDGLLLALAIAFILALGFASAPAIAPRSIAFLRPPLRGPPALA